MGTGVAVAVVKGLGRLIRELPGAFGDLGTFLPLALGLIAVCGARPAAVFIPAGVLALLSAWVYRLPIPIQPLKAACALAIASRLPMEWVAATGAWMALVMAVLAATGMAGWIAGLVPGGVVRGIQFGLGLLLVDAGGRWMFGWTGMLEPAAPQPIDGAVFWAALWVLFIPQLPLTLGNVLAATPRTARDYFGAAARRVTAQRLAWTMVAGNALAAVLGGMPVCHGSGGITAHARLGARTWRAPLLLGAGFLIVGMGGTRAAMVLGSIPPVVIGVLLVYVGVTHALLLRRAAPGREVSIALLTGMVALATHSLLWGIGAGVVAQVFLCGMWRSAWRPAIVPRGRS